MMALAETGVCACFLTGTQTMCEQRGGGVILVAQV